MNYGLELVEHGLWRITLNDRIIWQISGFRYVRHARNKISELKRYTPERLEALLNSPNIYC